MIHTYTVIKKNMAVINHLEWKEALDLADHDDLILTIKDNHVSAIRKVFYSDNYNGGPYKEANHIAGSIVPFYQ